MLGFEANEEFIADWKEVGLKRLEHFITSQGKLGWLESRLENIKAVHHVTRQTWLAGKGNGYRTDLLLAWF